MKLITIVSLSNLLVKREKLSILLIVLFVGGIFFFFLGQMYYDTRKDMFNHKAEGTFRNALQDKLQNESFEGYLFASKRTSQPNELPDTIYVYNDEGMHAYPLDKEKNSKNVTSDPNARIIHSEFLSAHPIDVDSLYKGWQKYLKKENIAGTFVLKLLVSDEKDSIATSVFPNVSLGENLAQCFRLTIGYRCEVDILGFCSPSFGQLVGIKGIAYSLLYWLSIIGIYGIIIYLKRKEKSISILDQKGEDNWMEQKIKYVRSETAQIYQLSESVIFDADRRKLIVDDKEISVYPQCAILLQHFLDTPDHILKDEEIVSLFWTEKTDNTNNIYILIGRLRKLLAKVAPIVIDRYEMSGYQLKILI